MTNPYEDLFKGGNAPDPNDPLLRPAVPPAEVDPIEGPHGFRRTNWILLVAYILGMILVNVVMYVIFFATYADLEGITENIVEVNVGYTTSESTLYPDYPYAVSIAGRFENQNEFVLGNVSADFSFYDADGVLLGTSSYAADDVESGEGLVVVDTLYFDAEVVAVEYERSFDMSSAFYLMVNAIHGLVMALTFVLIDRAHFADRWKRFWRSLGSHLGQIVAGEFFVYVALVVTTLLMDWLGISGGSQNEATIASMFKPDLFTLGALFLTLCVFTPIVEETIFRKVIFGFIPKRFGPVPPILLSGLIFGLMHVASYGDFLQSIPYVAMGFVFGYFYWMSKKNIYVTMGIHFLNNFISFAVYVAALYGIAL